MCQSCRISKMDEGNVCNMKGVAYGCKPKDNVHGTEHIVGWGLGILYDSEGCMR